MNRLRLITCLAVLCGGDLCAAQSNDAKFLEGLRERRLYRLIDLHCESCLADAEFPDARLVDVVVAWLRAGTQRALEAPPHERNGRWQQLNDLAKSSDRIRKTPRAVLIDLQLALATLARAEVLAEQPGDGKGAARTEFRRGLDALKSVDAAVFEKLQRSYQQPSSEQDWKTAELEALRRNLIVETARGFRRQALSFPVASPDRINALTLALEKLRAVTGLANLEPTVWRARVEQLVCLRLLQRIGEARSKIDEWHEARPPEEIASRLAGESLQLDLAAGEVRRALARAEAMLRDEKNIPVAETDHAILEVLLTARASQLVPEPVPEPGANERLTQLAAAQAQLIAHRHGPYWKRLAQARLGRALARSYSTDDPELLVHAAASLYEAGKLSEAVATFDRAATEYEQAGQEQRQFEAAHTAAAIVRQTDDAADTQHRFRQLSLRLPRHPQAAAAHLAAVGLAANRVREASVSSQSTAEESYEILLKEQLEIWPRGNEADTARWWWGRLRFSRGEWFAAIEQFSTVSRKSPQFGAATLAAAQCYERELSRLAKGAARVELVAAATEYLQPIVTGAENRWPEEWTELQRSVALRLSEMQLRHLPEGHDYAYKMLRAALRSSPDADATWESLATALAAAALARRGDVTGAFQMLWNEKTFTAKNVLLFLETVQFLQQPNEELQLEMAETVVRITDLTASSVEQAENKRTMGQLARYHGMAHELLGHRQKALVAYHEWMQYSPENGAAQETYATLVGKSRNPKYLRESLDVWQQIERRSKPAGPRWWRARRARIDLLEQLGKEAQAEKLRQITTVLHPRAVDELP